MAADARYGITTAIVAACYHRLQVSASGTSPTVDELEDMIDRAAAEATRIIQRRIAGWAPASASETSTAYLIGSEYVRAWSAYSLGLSRFGANDQVTTYRDDALRYKADLVEDLAALADSTPSSQGAMGRFSTGSTYTRSTADREAMSDAGRYFDEEGL